MLMYATGLFDALLSLFLKLVFCKRSDDRRFLSPSVASLHISSYSSALSKFKLRPKNIPPLFADVSYPDVHFECLRGTKNF